MKGGCCKRTKGSVSIRHEIYRRSHRESASRQGVRGGARCALFRVLCRRRSGPGGDRAGHLFRGVRHESRLHEFQVQGHGEGGARRRAARDRGQGRRHAAGHRRPARRNVADNPDGSWRRDKDQLRGRGRLDRQARQSWSAGIALKSEGDGAPIRRAPGRRVRDAGGAVTTAGTTNVETDVLVIGSGAAGMYAAIEAARSGAKVLLADRSLIGRGGATVMAQMTVAVALGEEVPDDPSHHYENTIAAGRGLCDEKLARLLCEDAPDCIRQLDKWGVGWARKNGHITATTAPGHDRPRCVYVDFINTGPAVSKPLRTRMARNQNIRKIGDLCIVDLVIGDGEITGAVGYHLGSGAPVVIAA